MSGIKQFFSTHYWTSPDLNSMRWLGLFTNKTFRKHRKLISPDRDFIICIVSLPIFHRRFIICIFPSAFYHPQFSILILSSAFYYASRLSVARGKFRAQVLPLKPPCCRVGNSACFHWKHIPVLTSYALKCAKNDKAANMEKNKFERKDFRQLMVVPFRKNCEN